MDFGRKTTQAAKAARYQLPCDFKMNEHVLLRVVPLLFGYSTTQPTCIGAQPLNVNLALVNQKIPEIQI